MKIYLPSGYSSEFYSNNHYYQPGVHDESEMPAELVAYLIKEKFACYILEHLADKLVEMEAEIKRLKGQEAKPVNSRSLTTDPNDPRLIRGSIDDTPRPQNEVYLVLSEEERAKGYVRPLRRAYEHVGVATKYPMRDLTEEEKERFAVYQYVKFEVYPESESPVTGRYWTQAQLNGIGGGCGAVTIISPAIAETYARDPQFYGSTYCTHCQMHRPVTEFVWTDDGTVVGS